MEEDFRLGDELRYSQKYLLWSIGMDVPDPIKCGGINKYVALSFHFILLKYKNCDHANKTSRKDWPNNISVSSAPTIRGPWTPFTFLLNGTNPAPFSPSSPSNQTTTAVLMDEDQTIFTAPSYLGPYTLLSKAPWNTTDFAPTWAEDPFLYQDFRGNFHVLAHWMIDLSLVPSRKYPRVGAHMFSRKLEGPWSFRQEYGPAFTSEVVFEDGSVEVFGRRERPKVFWARGVGRMGGAVLVTGVQELGKGGGSFTLVQGIGGG